jgi:ABC-type Fe3+ transport system substrate-binding protein
MPTFYELLEQNPGVSKELCSCGISIKDDGSSSLAAKIFSTKTLLRTNGVNPDRLSPQTLETLSNLKSNLNSPILVAFLPCGLRNAFKQALNEEFPEYADEECDDIIIEGNLNYEKLIYHYIDQMESADELPDIFISADFNSFYHHYFLHKFLNEKYFDAIPAINPSALRDGGFLHPENRMVMLTSNLLVMVVDTEMFPDEKVPKCWACLLEDNLSGSIVFRGDKDFFCNAAFFPFYKQWGMDAIRSLGKNTLTGMHPSEMVKSLNQGNPVGAKVYVMPYSFAIKIRNTERYKIIIPTNGAIASPVQMLVKKGAYQKHRKIIDFIVGKKMGTAFEKLGFPSVNPDGSEILKNKNIFWLGWDYLNQFDIANIKDDIQKIFFATYPNASKTK